jgi:hypothetical protein
LLLSDFLVVFSSEQFVDALSTVVAATVAAFVVAVHSRPEAKLKVIVGLQEAAVLWHLVYYPVIFAGY